MEELQKEKTYRIACSKDCQRRLLLRGVFGIFSFRCQLPSIHSAAEPQLALEDAGNDFASRKALPPLGAPSETF
jgi:hypothetical protein